MSATAFVIVTGSIIGLTVYCTRRYYSGAIKAKKEQSEKDAAAKAREEELGRERNRVTNMKREVLNILADALRYPEQELDMRHDLKPIRKLIKTASNVDLLHDRLNGQGETIQRQRKLITCLQDQLNDLRASMKGYI